jgi:hypothetical protein
LYVSANDLAERYGRTKQRSRRTLILAIAFGLGIVIVFGAWAIWVGLFQPTADIDYDDIGNSAVSANQIEVKWQLSVDPGKSTSCAVQALDANFGIVGWKIVDLPPSSDRSRTFSAIVRTAQPAVSGLIYQCWLS